MRSCLTISLWRQIFASFRTWVTPLAITFTVVPAGLTPTLLTPSAHAQVRIPAAAFEPVSSTETLMADVERLEGEGRWSEVLSLLDRARREFPADSSIQVRQRQARTHFDSQRRYADSSFVQLVRSADQRQAATIYREVLDKIETFHVDTPDYGLIFKQGHQALAVTLHSPAFHQVHQVAPTEAQLVTIDRLIADRVQLLRVTDRRSLEAAIAEMSETISQETGLPPAAITMEFACGATGALDWYSSFLTGDQYDEVMSQIRGDFVGLGVELRPTDEFLEILDVIPNGPAGEAGLRIGDRILAIDRIAVKDIGGNPAADRLRGEEGTSVQLSVETMGQAARLLTISRRRVEIASIRSAQIIDANHGVAYVKLAAFQRNTRDEMLKSLWDLHRQGMKSLVIDLRGNPGGLLDAAVEVADLFLPAGTIVTTRGRNLDENHIHRARFEGTWRVPVVVLIDGDSASASEILAGALRDNDRATIVGQRSYGKGSVQGIFSLTSCQAGLRLTTSKFFAPNGQWIGDGGVQPHVPVSVETQPQSDNEESAGVTTLRPSFDVDPTLAMAIRVASGQMQQLQP